MSYRVRGLSNFKNDFLSSISVEDFIKNNIENSNLTKEKLVTDAFGELENALLHEDIDYMIQLNTLLQALKENTSLFDFHIEFCKAKKIGNFLILSSKNNKTKSLNYLINNDCIYTECEDLSTLQVDSENHNAFYYAVRSNNIPLLDMLVRKWPGGINDKDLENVLSTSYKELKLRNVPLTYNMQFYVENKLSNLRIQSSFSLKLKQNQSKKNKSKEDKVKEPCTIEERIRVVLEIADRIVLEYQNNDKIDEKLLFMLTFVAENLDILKRQLRKTYSRLPWEEIEFCIVVFVSAQRKRHPNNVFYKTILSKTKIINYLQSFSEKLSAEIANLHVKKTTQPRQHRKDTIKNIIKTSPEFKSLYDDYQEVRDVHSLDIILKYLNLAIPSKKSMSNQRSIIVRALQVIGEYLNNSNDSPNLSEELSQLLLTSTMKTTKDILMDLRNSLSHSHSLSKRIQLEESDDATLFQNILQDIDQIKDVINTVVFKKSFKIIHTLLKQLNECQDISEWRRKASFLEVIDLNMIEIHDTELKSINRFVELSQELSDMIPEKTIHERNLFDEINENLKSIDTKLGNTSVDYAYSIIFLWIVKIFLVDENTIEDVKRYISEALRMFTEIEENNHIMENVFRIVLKIHDSIEPRLENLNYEKLNRLIIEMCKLSSFNNVSYLEALGDTLNITKIKEQSKKDNIKNHNYNTLIQTKLDSLQSMLFDKELDQVEKVMLFKIDTKLQTCVEILLLDILSIFNDSLKVLDDNMLTLDDSLPLMTGNCLRNYLAHGNYLLDIALIDPSISILSNALRLNHLKIYSQSYGSSLANLRKRFDDGLAVVINQEELFHSLMLGNHQQVKKCIEMGGDLFGENNQSQNCLHMAAKGSNLDIVKYIIDNGVNYKKDNSQRTPLHLAVTSGSDSVVKFFVEDKKFPVDETDELKMTPLHRAALVKNQNQIEIISILLNNNADIYRIDASHAIPLYYAIWNNCLEATKLLIGRNADQHEMYGGRTALQLASERGFLQIVQYLLENNANIESTCDKFLTPIYRAALNGHTDIVKVLIDHGANIHSETFFGETPFDCAVKNGHNDIVDILLKNNVCTTTKKKNGNTQLHVAAYKGHTRIVQRLIEKSSQVDLYNAINQTPLFGAVSFGHIQIVKLLIDKEANINIKDKNENTPLHLAAQNGHIKVVKLLVEKGAQVNMRNSQNCTPLHSAAFEGHSDIVTVLLDFGSKINLTTSLKNDTPLMLAIIKNHTDVVEVLLSRGADIKIVENDENSPLHLAVMDKKNLEVFLLLLDREINLNITNKMNQTPLHIAAIEGNIKAVEALIIKGADINLVDNKGNTPLHCAVMENQIEVVKILLQEAVVNTVNKLNSTPLCSAIHNNNKGIVDLLLTKDANINFNHAMPLFIAVVLGLGSIVKALFKKDTNIDIKNNKHHFFLHTAISFGSLSITECLISQGADINCLDDNSLSPLSMAVLKGNKLIVEILLKNGAKVNTADKILHKCILFNHSHIIDLLLQYGASIETRDEQDRTPFELAIVNNNPEIIEVLLNSSKCQIDINKKDDTDWTVLHLAALGGYFESVKFLISKGVNVHVRGPNGSKPIHEAARDGHIEIVQYFLNIGVNIDAVDYNSFSLLHYAALGGKSDMVKFLVDKNFDVNMKNDYSSTPLHEAANADSSIKVIQTLLNNGAIYNSVDCDGKKPVDLAKNKNVSLLLNATDNLFRAVKNGNINDLNESFAAGGAVNSQNTNEATPLHLASWKGKVEVVELLLENGANPNALGKNRCVPLHYAAKFSHIDVMKALMVAGAVYNIQDDNQKTPKDFATNDRVHYLLDLVDLCFGKVQYHELDVIEVLKSNENIDNISSVMNAQNMEKESFIIFAICNEFPRIQELIMISKDSAQIVNKIELAQLSQKKHSHCDVFIILQKLLYQHTSTLKTVDILALKSKMAEILLQKCLYSQSLLIFEDCFQIQKNIFGKNCKETLKTQNYIALIYHYIEKHEDSLKIYKEIFNIQEAQYGTNSREKMSTILNIANQLVILEKKDEAFEIIKQFYDEIKTTQDFKNLKSMEQHSTLAVLLTIQGKFDEALQIHSEVYAARKNILGINHLDTLRSQYHMAVVFAHKNESKKALDMLKEVYNLQNKELGPSHRDTLETKMKIKELYSACGRFITGIKLYSENIEKIPKSIMNLQKYNTTNAILKIENIQNVIDENRNKLFENVARGNLQAVKELFNQGFSINSFDTIGRNPLHFAISNGHKAVINFLLDNGGNIAQVSKKGNTPLHVAVNKKNKEIVKKLLEKAVQTVYIDDISLINTKTIASGSSALHVAVKNDCLDIVQLLLANGANYQAMDSKNQTPGSYSNNHNITQLLKTIDRAFSLAKLCDSEIFDLLNNLSDSKEYKAIVNARNNEGLTVTQEALVEDHIFAKSLFDFINKDSLLLRTN